MTDVCVLWGLFWSFLSLNGFLEMPNNFFLEFQWRHSVKLQMGTERVGCFAEASTPPAKRNYCHWSLVHYLTSYAQLSVDIVGHSVDRARPCSALVHDIIDSLSPARARKNYLFRVMNHNSPLPQKPD